MKIIAYPFLTFLLLMLLAGSCALPEKEVMTPTKMTNIILKSVFERDSSLFEQLLYTKEELIGTVNLAKIKDEVKKNEMKIINDKFHYIVYRDSCMAEFRELIRAFDSLGIKPFTMDTVDFNNYMDLARPYFRLEADSWIPAGQDTFVLKIKNAILLTDGWNLGSVKLLKASSDNPDFLRVKDRILAEEREKLKANQQ